MALPQTERAWKEAEKRLIEYLKSPLQQQQTNNALMLAKMPFEFDPSLPPRAIRLDWRKD